MSQLSVFLGKKKYKIDKMEDIIKEIIISKRLLNEDGTPIVWKIRAVSQEQNEEITARHTTIDDKTGFEIINRANLQADLITECVVEPDLKDNALCTAFGVYDPINLVKRMLTAGEYSKLVDAIMKINNFRNDDQEEYEKAKKS